MHADSAVCSWYDDYPRFSDRISPAPVLFMVKPYNGVVRNHHVLVDYCPLDFHVPADGNVFKQDRVLDEAVAVDFAEWTEDRAPHCAATRYASRTDIRV